MEKLTLNVDKRPEQDSTESVLGVYLQPDRHSDRGSRVSEPDDSGGRDGLQQRQCRQQFLVAQAMAPA